MAYERYFPSTIPGHHLPHAWLERDGHRCAVRDLLALCRLTLFTCQPFDFQEQDDRVELVTLGPQTWYAVCCDWEKVNGANDARGLLARPDGIVAWRGVLTGHDRRSWQELVSRVLRIRD